MKIQFKNQKIAVFESALYRTTSTLIDLGTSLIIVDPNWLPLEITYIKNWIDQHYPNHQQYLFFTHSDFDHIIGYQEFSKAKVIASKAFVLNPGKHEILQQIKDFDNEYYIQRTYPILYPEVDIIIEQEKQTLIIGDHSLIFYHATGHVSDGLFMIIPSLNLWIAGDYLSNIEMPFVDHDYHAYCNTLSLAEQWFDQYPELNILVPGHGDVAIERSEISNRIAKDQKYLQCLQKEKDEHISIQMLELIYSYQNNPKLVEAHMKNVKRINLK